MHIFADAFIPLSPVSPVSQVVLLIVIILLEGSFIRKRLMHSSNPQFRFWLRISGANVATAVIGLLLAYPIMTLEFALAFGWGSDTSHPILWYTACALSGIGLPWLVWFLCYNVSWRVEFWLLKQTKGVAFSDSSLAKKAVRDAHRWSYALLAVPVIYVTLWYWTSVFHPL